MRRKLIPAAAALALALIPGLARAEDYGNIDEDVDLIGPEVAKVELGARLGLQAGAGTTTGGFRIAGAYLHRMTASTWFDAEAAFVFGGSGEVCYFDRNVDLVCAPGLVDGFAAQFAAGGRWFPTVTESGFVPYVRAGAALHIPSFGDDDVSGVALPLWAGAGGRYRVSSQIAISGELVLFGGGAVYNHDLGLEPYAGMLVQFGVDLAP
jgi:hypothetical protein